MRDAVRQIMLTLKKTNKLINNLLRSVPAIALIARRRRQSVVPYILGAVGVAIVGGITAVMILSPRTRNRTLGMAKDSYGKVKGQIDQLGIGERIAARRERLMKPDAYSNGLSPESNPTGSSTY